ncbi:MAG: hypothetical protein HQK91_14195 [Nitrospirae bacterium]|nr:hypothetical protein [Nitrospirota bacterium]
MISTIKEDLKKLIGTKKVDILIIIAVIISMWCFINTEMNKEPDNSNLNPHSPFAKQKCCGLAGLITDIKYEHHGLGEYYCTSEKIYFDNILSKCDHGDPCNSMFYHADGDHNGANVLEAVLLIYDIKKTKYPRERFGEMTNTLLKNVFDAQEKALYNYDINKIPAGSYQKMDKTLLEVYDYAVNKSIPYDKNGYWEILGTIITLEEINERIGYTLVLSIKPQVKK